MIFIVRKAFGMLLEAIHLSSKTKLQDKLQGTMSHLTATIGDLTHSVSKFLGIRTDDDHRWRPLMIIFSPISPFILVLQNWGQKKAQKKSTLFLSQKKSNQNIYPLSFC